MSRELVVRGTGQEDNIGDVVLRWESPVATGPLILSGLVLVAIFAVPVARIGLLVSALVPQPIVAVAIGLGASALYAAVVVILVPPYRATVSVVGGVLARRRSRAAA